MFAGPIPLGLIVGANLTEGAHNSVSSRTAAISKEVRTIRLETIFLGLLTFSDILGAIVNLNLKRVYVDICWHFR